MAASAPVSYPHDNEWLQDKHVITFLAERAYLNVVDEPLAWNYLVRAIMRHREMTEANARKSNWLQRRHFMLVNSEAHDVERGSQQGCHWFVVAFDGRKVRQAGFIVFAWDPKATNEYMSSFLDSCKENDIEVRAKALGHQPVGDNWTCGYHSLGYICLLARTEIGTDLGALVLPPMAADFVGQVQACLREAAMTSSDTVDETLSGVTGAVASVRVNTQLWLAEMHGVPQTFHWVQVKVVGRKCQGLVPLEYVRPPYAKVRAPLKHLFATMTAQMQRICGKRPKTNHPSPAQAAQPSPSTPSALEHAPAQVSEPSPPPSPSLEHASAPVTEPSPSPSPPLEHGPAQVPKPSPSPSSPLHGPSVKSVPKDLHRKASKGDKVCAVFTHHLRTGDKGFLHWGKVLAVEGSECTIKWQTDKKPSSHSIADVFLTEAAAWAAFHSIPSSDSASEAPLYPDSDHEATGPKTSLRSAAQVNTQPGTSQSREALYINKKRFEVPEGYTGNLRHDQQKCDEFWKVIVHDRRKSSEIRLSPANQARAEAVEKLTGQKFSREQRVFLRVCGQYMEEE